jgi:hypothetical protein
MYYTVSKSASKVNDMNTPRVVALYQTYVNNVCVLARKYTDY